MVRFRDILVTFGVLCAGSVSAQPPSPPTAAEIMQRVAANQERAGTERAHYVYVQHARVASRRGKKLLCEEVTDSRITPQAAGTQRELLKLQGRLWFHKRYMDYTHLLAKEVKYSKPEPKPKAEQEDSRSEQKPDSDATLEINVGDGEDIDVNLVEHLRKNLTDTQSKDGFAAGLFPLTAKAADAYDYRLIGPERMNGRETFHITFAPKATSDFDWKGDAWIDTAAFQPVLVRTKLSRNVPFLVKTMLGTSVPGLGFAVTYAPQPDGTWFPTSFGTEFKIHVLFFFSREITMAAQNTGFQKTHVESRIVTGAVASPAPGPVTVSTPGSVPGTLPQRSELPQ